jgi:hypothetical protein
MSGARATIQLGKSKPQDDRIGKTARLLTHGLVLENNGCREHAGSGPCKVLSTHKSGYGSIHDLNGVLRIEAPSGQIYLTAARHWIIL